MSESGLQFFEIRTVICRIKGVLENDSYYRFPSDPDAIPEGHDANSLRRVEKSSLASRDNANPLPHVPSDGSGTTMSDPDVRQIRRPKRFRGHGGVRW